MPTVNQRAPLRTSQIVQRTFLTSGTLLAVAEACVATLVLFLDIFSQPITGGCGGMIGVGLFVLGVWLLVATAGLVVVMVLGALGAAFLWTKPQAGEAFAFITSVAALVALALPGPVTHVALGWVVLLAVLAAAPVAVIAMLLWLWAGRSPTLAGRIATPVVVALALSPIVWWSSGVLTSDINAAFPSAPTPVASTAHGCGSAGG